jgi:aminomethyltransferase
MFDVSHMARLRFTGDRVIEFIEHITTNDVSKLSDRQGQYSLLPNAAGGLVDDIIVYRISSTEIRMVVNASNHAKDVAHIEALNTYGVEMADHTEATAMIAVQGPKAGELIAGLSDDPDAINAAGMFDVVNCSIGGVQCFAPRSGYTGEDGFELICPAADAPALWDALAAAGVKPCGLGSRDVLRVEAGLPLYGHELGEELSPLSAGLSWVISEDKSFVGSDHIAAARVNKTPHLLRGIQMDGRRIPAPGATVTVDGEEVGTVSSGVYSPLLEKGIAFAFLKRKIKIGFDCEVDIRGKKEPAKVSSRRFFKRA